VLWTPKMVVKHTDWSVWCTEMKETCIPTVDSSEYIYFSYA
jgi:hypothetical protein